MTEQASTPPNAKRKPGRPAVFDGCQVCGVSLQDCRLFHQVGALGVRRTSQCVAACTGTAASSPLSCSSASSLPCLPYVQRYHICMEHMMAPSLIVKGMAQRFCQQARKERSRT